MFSNGRAILQFTHLRRIYGFSSKTLSIIFPQQFFSHNYKFKKHFGCSIVRLEKDEVPSTLSKYELFSERTTPTILDVEEERQKITCTEEVSDEFGGINLERGGISGVFDIEDIVELLKKEKGEDIFVVQIPKEYNYADYMVIVSGRSAKHMAAMSDFVRRLYKLKVGSQGYIPHLEGKDSNIWKAIDLGNIILHVFSKEGREVYDLETLWSVGKDFDIFSKKQSTSVLSDYSKILATLSPNT